MIKGMINRKNKLLLSIVLILACLFLFTQDYTRQLSLQNLRNYKFIWEGYDQSHPVSTAGIFIGIYIVTIALSIPGSATFLMLLGGALFGFWKAMLFVSLASPIGATLAFFTSRFLFREMLEERFRT